MKIVPARGRRTDRRRQLHPVSGQPAHWRDAFLGGFERGGEPNRVCALDFPADGDYVVPGALVPVSVRDGHGTYREPCVWIRHSV